MNGVRFGIGPLIVIALLLLLQFLHPCQFPLRNICACIAPHAYVMSPACTPFSVTNFSISPYLSFLLNQGGNKHRLPCAWWTDWQLAFSLLKDKQKERACFICSYTYIQVFLLSDPRLRCFCPDLRFYVSAYSLARVDNRSGPYTEWPVRHPCLGDPV